MDNNYTDQHELYVKFLTGDISQDEIVQLRAWIALSEEHRRDLWEFCRFYHAVDASSTIHDAGTEAALSKLLDQIDTEPKKKTLLQKIPLQWMAAAVILPLLCFSLYFYLYRAARPINLPTIEYSTNPGMIAQIKLPDSSTVWLNADSKITVEGNFKQNRTIKLDGEAFFQVEKDKDHAFRVFTVNGPHIEVLGTRFNVEAYGKSNTVRTTLEEGKVAFWFMQEGKQKQVMMRPDESIVYDVEKQELRESSVNTQTAIAWKDNRIILENTSMRELTNILRKRFDVQVVLKTPSLKSARFTGELSTQTLQSVLEYLKLSSGIDYKIVETMDEHNRVELSKTEE